MDKKKRILIVEDQGMIALDMAQIVRDAGYEVTGIVMSVEVAVEQADRNRPDLVLMELFLAGDGDSRETGVKIHKSFGASVIFVTHFGDAKVVEKARLNAPAGLGYLVKPFEKNDLINEIERVLLSDTDTDHRLPMQSFEWLKSFNTGSVVIDGQHQELMDCLKEMSVFVGEGKGEKVHAKCLELRRLLDTHFADEEGILRDAEYPRLDSHLVSHGETTKQFSHTCTSCMEVCKDNRSGPCLLDMASILLYHFLHGDMDFKSFLQTKGLANDSH